MKILNVEILSNDLDKTEKFYSDVLCFELQQKSKDSISFTAGQTTLTFNSSNYPNPVYHFAFNIPNNQLNEALEWTKQKVEIMDVTPGDKIADFVNWDAKSFYFYDSNGNILEFIARFDLDNKSTVPFNSDSIISISEIGVATDDVAVESDRLINNCNLPVFSKQPRMPNFTALGDHDGLLILSGASRHWYPTDKTAQKLYTRLCIETNGQTQWLQFHKN